MLNWRVRPHPWFQELVQWALYKAIIRCDRPDYFDGLPLTARMALPHMVDADLRRMCTVLLRGSKRDVCLQPTGYQFVVLRRVISWVLNDTSAVAAASGNINIRYCPPSDVLPLVLSRPQDGDYELTLALPPALNSSDPATDMELCLFTEPLTDHNNHDPS